MKWIATKDKKTIILCDNIRSIDRYGDLVYVNVIDNMKFVWKITDEQYTSLMNFLFNFDYSGLDSYFIYSAPEK